MAPPITKIRLCVKCKERIPPSMRIAGKRRDFDARKFCIKCVPFKTPNNGAWRTQRTDGKKRCAGACQKELPVAAFGRRDAICKTCRALKVKIQRRSNKIEAINYLGGKCKRCGYNKYLYALQFHHQDPSKKDFEIGRRRKAQLSDIKVELDKCELLCMNCHAEAHGEAHE